MKFEKIKPELSAYGRFEERDRTKYLFFVDDILHYAYWYAYLQISPSYTLAERIHRGQTVDRSSLPDDIDDVVKTYRRLGNVRETDFKQWWHLTGLDVFGYLADEPEVYQVARTFPGDEEFESADDALQWYAGEEWLCGGNQPTLIVAIPLVLPKKTIVSQLKSILDSIPQADKASSFDKPDYEFIAKRFDKVSLQRYHWAVMCKAYLHEPGQTLPSNWKVEHFARVYGRDGDAQAASVFPNLDRTERHTNAEKARLDIERAWLIAENAARRRFPSQEKNRNALSFDFDDLHKALAMRN